MGQEASEEQGHSQATIGRTTSGNYTQGFNACNSCDDGFWQGSEHIKFTIKCCPDFIIGFLVIMFPNLKEMWP